MRKRLTSIFLPAVLLTLGCGIQDLYETPDSPYQPVGQVLLPSMNEGVAVMDDYAFVAAGQAGLHVVDISTPSDPVLMMTLNTTKYAESIALTRTFFGGSMTDIALVVEGTEGITSYDITDPGNTSSYEQGTTAVDGNGLYVLEPENPEDPFTVFLAESWKGIRVFQANPEVPGLLEYNGVFAGTQGRAMGIEVRDGFAYVADDEMGLAVLDVSVLELGAVQMVSWADTRGNALDVALDGDYAFIADGTMGIVAFQIDGGSTPVLVGELDLAAYSRSIVVRDGLAFLAAATGGVHVIDVSDPANMVYAGNVMSSYATNLCLTPDGLILVTDQEEGLLVLEGAAFVDQVSPGAVVNLAALASGFESLTLSWQAGGDDGFQGQASSLNVRQSSSPIASEVEWDAATPLSGAPLPGLPGETQGMTISGFTPGETAYFAIRTLDDAGLQSAIASSDAAETFSGMVLASSGVNQMTGEITDTFIFEAVYLNEDSLEPVSHEVLIDGASFSMSFVSGDFYTGALYRYETLLDPGSHRFSFHFDDGAGHVFDSEEVDGLFAGTNMTFTMGSPLTESGRELDEVEHLVSLSDTLLASPYEVTQAEWVAMGLENPSAFTGDSLPVESVTWLEAIEYCNLRSVADGYGEAYSIDGSSVSWNQDAEGWRLPTEAEWEWLCRAESEEAFSGGGITFTGCDIDPVLGNLGWYCGNSGESTHDVGQMDANDLGLYDMHGNVWEWCWDWYGALGEDPVLDPQGPGTGDQRVVRGGSWFYFASDCRSASRGSRYPDSADDTVGFRVVRTLH
jgi:formylglycine-generating enzyme required for sulfatase activity